MLNQESDKNIKVMETETEDKKDVIVSNAA